MEVDSSEGLSPSILLESRVYFAHRDNSTTAKAKTSKGHANVVSICLAAPPAVSYVCIHCPDLPHTDFSDEPCVVRREKQFVLLHLPLWSAWYRERVHEY
ncbi:hypothetical protein ZWY2020_004283 [Hordeum vulgare]|nr:hypothetical protein ZWY2020_004283 [Hordeum vulgare]